MGGRDKALMTLGGKPLIQHVMDRLAPQTVHLAISANGDAARFAWLGVPVIDDGQDPSEGPAYGIRAALEWAAACGDVEWIVTVPTDTPFIPLDLVERLVGKAQTGNAAVAVAGNSTDKHPTIAVWSLSIRRKLNALVERDGLRAVHAIGDALGATVVQFDRPVRGPEPFFNINSPADLKDAQERIDER